MPPIITFPIPVPGVGVTPAPGIGVTPSPGVGVSPAVPIPFLPGGGTTGSFTKPFADLFDFGIDWRYLLAIFLLLVTVNIVEGWNENAAWVYVAILLLGVLTVNTRTRNTFSASLNALIRSTKLQG